MPYPGQRTIAGNAHAGSGDAGGGKSHSRPLPRLTGRRRRLRQSPAGTLLTSTYARKAPCRSFPKFLALRHSDTHGTIAYTDTRTRTIRDPQGDYRGPAGREVSGRSGRR
jgi:hypothetical protein